MIKKILAIVLSMAMLTTFTACSDKKEKVENTQEPVQTQEVETTENPELYADAIPFTIELENGGVMKGELYPNLAPITVENFVKLCEEDFYKGLIFHRVIEGFMIQGGGYDIDLQPKETDEIKGEFDANGFKNPLKHTRGVISMARTNIPDSASSQFFLMHEDSPHLDGQYAAFGRITEGLEIIDEIATSETKTDERYGLENFPVKPPVIKTITVNN